MDLSGLKIGDRIYCTVNYGSTVLIKTILGETDAKWIIRVAGTKESPIKGFVRKSDGYLVGSDDGTRMHSRTYYEPLTDEIEVQYRKQVLRRKYQDLPDSGKLRITRENFEEIKTALQVLYKYSADEPVVPDEKSRT
jgi:hypothetical protein